MLATMERPTLAQPFSQLQHHSPLSIRSSSMQSPRTASIAFHSASTFGIPSPPAEGSNQYSMSSGNTADSRCANSNPPPCLTLPVHSPPQHQYQGDLMDPSASMYPNSSMTAMIPPPATNCNGGSPQVDCYKHDPTCSPSSCSLSHQGSIGSPPGSAASTPQQQQQGQLGTLINRACACLL